MMMCRPSVLSDVSKELAAAGYKELVFLDQKEGGGRLLIITSQSHSTI
jgi:hypothetical protein